MKKRLMLLLFALLGWNTMAYSFEVDGIYYYIRSLAAKEVGVTWGIYPSPKNERTDYSGSVVIPATVEYVGETFRVVAIGKSAFENCEGLTSITIPEGVDTIERDAFNWCTGLTSITIPESVTYIGGLAFAYCDGLRSVKWNARHCSDLGSYTFGYSDYQIVSITFGDKVEHIPARLCRGQKGLRSITLPESVTSIGEDAFLWCSGLTSVTLPESVTSIGEDAFSGTSIRSPLYNSKVFAYMPVDYSGEYAIPSGIQTIAPTAFSGCSSLMSVTFPESVTAIGDKAFYGCSGLTSITLPESVISIGRYAFAGTSISGPLYNSTIFAYMSKDYSGEYAIPDGIQKIAGGAFEDCGLTSITIPESVTSIGGSAFENCTGLTSVEWNARHCESGNLFSESLKSITFGQEVEHIPDSLCWGTSIKSVTIPKGVIFVGSKAFRCLSLLEVEWNARHCADFYYGYDNGLVDTRPFAGILSITFGDEVEHIPACLCYEQNIMSLTIPESVTSIGGSAFENCTGLTSVEWNARHCADFYYGYDNGLVDTRPFAGIISITFGDEVEHIPAYLCYRLEGLTSVTLPESVTSAGGEAFRFTGISSPLYNSRLFVYMPTDYSGEYTIPDGIQTIAPCAFDECSGLTSITVPASVTSIGEYAFRRCTGLTSVEWNARHCADFRDGEASPFYSWGYGVPLTAITFGDSVAHIPAYLCYSRQSGLTSITIPESVTSIGEDAFWGCSFTSATSLAKVPPYCEGDGALGGINGTLYVPRGSRSAYKSAQGWRNYNIEDGTRTVTLRVEDESMGRVTGGGDYEPGAQATIEAIPNSGYRFVRWQNYSLSYADQTKNPLALTVNDDITLTAIFAKNGDTPPPTANEATLSAAPIAYVQGRTAYLADGLGEVEAFTATGQRVYRGTARTLTLPRPGIYVLRVVADGRRCKVVVK